MDSGGPYLNAAVLCERVLVEQDQVLSVVRIVDRITLTAVSAGIAAPEQMPGTPINLFALVVLKSGIFKGTAAIRLALQSPSQNTVVQFSTDVFFDGDDRGVNLVLPLQLQVQEDGLYWLEVYHAESLMTRVPLRVIYQRLVQGSLPLPRA